MLKFAGFPKKIGKRKPKKKKRVDMCRIQLTGGSSTATCRAPRNSKSSRYLHIIEHSSRHLSENLQESSCSLSAVEQLLAQIGLIILAPVNELNGFVKDLLVRFAAEEVLP